MESFLLKQPPELQHESPESANQRRRQEIAEALREKHPEYRNALIPSWMLSENPVPPEPISPPVTLLKRGKKEPREMTREEFGQEAPLYHGTTAKFKGPPKIVPTVGTSHLGVFATTSREYAELSADPKWGGRVIPLRIRPDARLINERDVPAHLDVEEERNKWLRDHGYDAILFRESTLSGEPGTTVVGMRDNVFEDHEQIVRRALLEKEAVPQNVRAQYPKLVLQTRLRNLIKPVHK